MDLIDKKLVNKERKKNKICGIYILESLIKDKWFGGKYVGQSTDIKQRKISHLKELKTNNHENKKLQRYYNKYGKDSLKFTFLMECSENELNFWEKWWIKSFDSYKTKYNFNLTKGGEDRSHFFKKGLLKNMKTGKVIEFNSIKEFAESYNLNKSSISQLLSGNRKYIFDWYNPNGKWQPKYYEVISPDNKTYIVIESKVAEFCKEHGMKGSGFNEMLKGNYNFYNGWHRINSVKLESNRFRYNKFKLISPEGKIFEGENISRFAKIHNLPQSNLNQVFLGKRNNCQGWKLYKKKE